MQTCVGFDIGRSSVKIVATWGDQRVEILYPSSVVQAFKITDDLEAHRASLETVQVNGRDYFFGETALLQGADDLAGGMRDDWLKTDQHAALFLGGLKKLQLKGVPNIDTAIVILGTPASHYASQKDELHDHLSPLATRAELRILPQPLGPYHQMMFTKDGDQNESIRMEESSWAIIEVGQYTTDIALVLQGRIIENAFGSCEGMSLAADRLQKILQAKGYTSVTMVEGTEMLRTKTLKEFGQKIDVSDAVKAAAESVSEKVIDKANQLIGKYARTLDGIIVAGGGAPLILPSLSNEWRHARLSENSRFSVAEGFCRFALAIEKNRKLKALRGE